jgi:hypothetical protein
MVKPLNTLRDFSNASPICVFVNLGYSRLEDARWLHSALNENLTRTAVLRLPHMKSQTYPLNAKVSSAKRKRLLIPEKHQLIKHISLIFKHDINGFYEPFKLIFLEISESAL